MDRIDIHEDLCAELHKLYVAKNTDYGDSFAKVREEIPNAILVRLSDKLNRLKSLMTKDDDERKVLDESIDDTLMDIANYALLELVERRYEGDYYCDIEYKDDEEEEDEEEEYTGSFSDAFDAFRDAVSAIKSSFCKQSRQNWIDSESLHDEIFTEFIPILNKLKVVHYVMKNGEVIDHDVSYYDEDDDINLNVTGWKEHMEAKDDDEDDERMSSGLNIKRDILLNDWNHVELFIKKDDETGSVTIDKFIMKDQEVVSHHKSDLNSEGIYLKFNDLFEYKDKTKTRIIFDKVERDLSGRTVDIRTVVTSEYRPAYKDFHVNTRVYYDETLIADDWVSYQPEAYYKKFGGKHVDDSED